jgi:hypothetical protein
MTKTVAGDTDKTEPPAGGVGETRTGRRFWSPAQRN